MEGAEERAPRARERDGYADTDLSCRWPLRQICGSPRPFIERRRVTGRGIRAPGLDLGAVALLAIVRNDRPECLPNKPETVPSRGMRGSDNETIFARSLSRPSRSSAEIEFDQSDLCECPLSPRLRRYGD